MLSIRSLTKIHPPAKAAISGFSLDIPEGVFGLLGPNGAGKTSLMEILAAHLRFESGSAILDGALDVMKSPQQWRRQLGYMPQTFDFPAHTTGREMLEEGALLLGFSPRALAPRIDYLLDRVNLSRAADRDCSKYSRGMKQRLGFALSVLHDPRLLLLDEPTAGLDPEERVFFRDLLAEIGRGRIVILSTHIVPDVERCCTRLAVMDRGRLKFAGTPGGMLAMASGRVWEMALPPGARIEDFVATRRVVRVRHHDRHIWVRMVGDEPPAPDAIGVEARLEDAYMQLLEGTAPLEEEGDRPWASGVWATIDRS